MLHDATPAIDPRRARRLVTQLMAIRGPSGGETPVARFITDQLFAAGLSRSAVRFDDAHRKSPLGGECGNLIVKLPASGAAFRRAPRRLLMAHMDTVPVCLGSKPVVKAGRVVSADKTTGLGADDRSGCAVVLLTALEILRRGLPHPPLTLLWCVQEEVGLFGARHLDVRKLGDPAMGFNFDGGAPAQLCIGATGAWRLTIRITGIPAHAGVHPEQGVSAIAIAALAIAELQRGGWHGLVLKHGLRGSSNVGVIRGGDATNVVTHDLLLKAEARAHDKKLRKEIVDAYRAAFTNAARSVRNTAGKTGKVKFEIRHDYEAFRLAPDHAAVRTAAAALETAGLKPDLKIGNGGLDANWMATHKIPTVTLGCGQHDIHTTAEWLDLHEFQTACNIALRLATA